MAPLNYLGLIPAPFVRVCVNGILAVQTRINIILIATLMGLFSVTAFGQSTGGAKTVDGVKRRVRPGMGLCQGGFCGPQIVEIISNELNRRK